MEENTIDITIKTMNNIDFRLSIAPSTTIFQLKELIKNSTEVIEERQRLIYQGKVLQDSTTIQENKIESGHALHMVARPIGSSATPSQQSSTTPTAFHSETDYNSSSSSMDESSTSSAAPEIVTLEHVRQGLLTSSTLLSTMPAAIHQEVSSNSMFASSSSSSLPNTHLSPSFSTSNIRFYVGQWIDVKDTVGQWLEATVLDINNENRQIFVTYNGWPSRWDEWIPMESPRIAPFRAQSTPGQSPGGQHHLAASSRPSVWSACVSPTPTSLLSDPPVTGCDDVRTLLPELSKMLEIITPAIQRAAALSVESIRRTPPSVSIPRVNTNLNSNSSASSNTSLPSSRSNSTSASSSPRSTRLSSEIDPEVPWSNLLPTNASLQSPSISEIGGRGVGGGNNNNSINSINSDSNYRSNSNSNSNRNGNGNCNDGENSIEDSSHALSSLGPDPGDSKSGDDGTLESGSLNGSAAALANSELLTALTYLSPLCDRLGRVLSDISPFLHTYSNTLAEAADPSLAASTSSSTTTASSDQSSSASSPGAQPQLSSFLRQRSPSPPASQLYRSPLDPTRAGGRSNSQMDIHIAIIAPQRGRSSSNESIMQAISSLTSAMQVPGAASSSSSSSSASSIQAVDTDYLDTPSDSPRTSTSLPSSTPSLLNNFSGMFDFGNSSSASLSSLSQQSPYGSSRGDLSSSILDSLLNSSRLHSSHRGQHSTANSSLQHQHQHPAHSSSQLSAYSGDSPRGFSWNSGLDDNSSNSISSLRHGIVTSNNVSRGSSGDLNNRWDAISQSLFGDNVDESIPSIDQTISEDDESEVFVDATSEDTISNEAGRSTGGVSSSTASSFASTSTGCRNSSASTLDGKNGVAHAHGSGGSSNFARVTSDGSDSGNDSDSIVSDPNLIRDLIPPSILSKEDFNPEIVCPSKRSLQTSDGAVHNNLSTSDENRCTRAARIYTYDGISTSTNTASSNGSSLGSSSCSSSSSNSNNNIDQITSFTGNGFTSCDSSPELKFTASLTPSQINEGDCANKDEVESVPDNGINSNSNNNNRNSSDNSNSSNISNNSNISNSVTNSNNNRTEPNPSLMQRLRRSFLFNSTVD